MKARLGFGIQLKRLLYEVVLGVVLFYASALVQEHLPQDGLNWFLALFVFETVALLNFVLGRIVVLLAPLFQILLTFIWRSFKKSLGY